MKKSLCFFIMILVAITNAAQTEDVNKTIHGLSLPVLNIWTIHQEEPTCEYVTHPQGSMGKSITNATKVPASMSITLGDDILFDSGEYQQEISGLTIKIRGNTSAYYDKKPYKLSLQKKHDLLRRGNDNIYKDKQWLLLPINPCTMTGLKLNELLGMPYTPQYQIVNVLINDNYRGLYMLMESVKRNSSCRVNIDQSNGFLVELDPYWWNEDIYFDTSMHNDSKYKYTFKHPDSDDVTNEQIVYIQKELNKMEASLQNGNYNDCIDVATFAKWLLGHDILGTQDMGGSNRFYAKYDKNATNKIFIPCMWDFDTMAKTKDQWAMVHNNDEYYQLLIQSSQTDFIEMYTDLWVQQSDRIFQQMDSYLENLVTTDEWAAAEKSLFFDQERWNYTDCTLAEDVETVRKWLKERQIWMTSAMENMQTSIYVVAHGKKQITNDEVYTLQGTSVGVCKDGKIENLQLPKGIYILHNKKVVVK